MYFNPNLSFSDSSFIFSDANGEMITREIIIGIITQRDLLNYITKPSDGAAVVNDEL